MKEERMVSLAEAKRVSEVLREDGHEGCTARKVAMVAAGESLPDETYLESAILQELDIA